MPIASLLASVFGGGLTGLIGTCVQRFTEFKTKQLEIQENKDKYAHDLDMKKADADIMAQEWAARTKIADTEAKAEVQKEDSAAFSAAITSEPQKYSDPAKATTSQTWLYVVLDLIRGLVRPGLTLYLCVLTTLVYYQAYELLKGQTMTVDNATSLVSLIIHTILYLTTTCVLFWFGTRNKSKPPTT